MAAPLIIAAGDLLGEIIIPAAIKGTTLIYGLVKGGKEINDLKKQLEKIKNSQNNK